MPDQKRKEFQRLVDKYLNGTATPVEQEALDKYFLLFRDEPENSTLLNKEQLAGLEQRMESELFNRIHKPVKVIRLWPRIAAASSILLFLSIGGYYIFHKQPIQQTAQNQNQDIAPGHNQATLTLANGQKIVLTKGLSGKLAQQGNTSVAVNAGNSISYTNGKPSEEVLYNTLSTARGEQSPYPLILADGTKVWLNAESSISYPTVFNGKERVVKVTGEAYFEIAHNEKQPFKALSAHQTVEDIGTHFDLDTYPDEPAVKTTLLEGSVKVSSDKQSLVLKPGSQARQSGGKLTEQGVNTAHIVAWKDGYFRFQNEDIQSIMRQLTRWYNIEVIYQGSMLPNSFSGRVSRNRSISAVLQMMEKTQQVKFKIEGRRVTVIQ